MRKWLLVVVVLVLSGVLISATGGTPGLASPPDRQLTQTDSPMVTLTANATVRAWPSDQTEIIGEIPARSMVVTNGRTTDAQWWRIPYPGGPDGNGWVRANVVEPNAAAANVPVIEVVFASGYRANGQVIGKDLDSDIAVLSVDVPADEIHPLALGSSSNVKVGQQVVAIGNPYGLSGTMTLGIVSARGRMLDSMRESPSGGYFTAADLIQTDAAINPGNSGGPLLNLNGEVIGINRAIRTNGEDGVSTLSNSGIGFAVPIDVVKRVTPDLIANGSYDYPYMGIVSREELTLSEREYLSLPADAQGAYVISVLENGPAAQGGMIGATSETVYTALPKGGDLITAVDDQPVRTFSDLLSFLVAHKSPGDSMNVTVLRDGASIDLTIVLTKRPE